MKHSRERGLESGPQASWSRDSMQHHRNQDCQEPLLAGHSIHIADKEMEQEIAVVREGRGREKQSEQYLNMEGQEDAK